MKGSEQVIAVLNQVRRKELTGINQYFIHAKMRRVATVEARVIDR
jgi:bacterioferritin (cytochrome b1)